MQKWKWARAAGLYPPSPVLLVNCKRDHCVVTVCKGCYSRVCGSADISPTGVWVTSGGPAVAVAMGGEGGGSCDGVIRAGETRDPNF